MFGSKKNSPPTVVTPPAPPSVEEQLNDAELDTAYALDLFRNTARVLGEANEAYAAVEDQADAEIVRFTEIRDRAAAQRAKNDVTIANLAALTGDEEPVVLVAE